MKPIITAIFATVVWLSVAWTGSAPGPTTDATDQTGSVELSSRTWGDVGERLHTTPGDDEEGMLYRPLILDVGPEGRMHVVDYGDSSIKQYSADGTFLRQIGTPGGGQGPGEFINPTDVEVARSGKIWVADPVTSRLTIFEPDGSSFQTVPMRSPVTRLALHPEEGVYATQRTSASDDAAFDIRRTTDHEVIHSFGNLIENQAQNSMSIDGRIGGAADGFYFSATYAGRIIKYDWEGNTMSVKPTVEDAPFEPVFVDEMGGRRVTAPVRARGVKVDTSGDEPRVCVVTAIPGAKRKALDVYSLSGDYRYSFRLPLGARKAVLRGDVLYVLQDTRVDTYRVSVPASGVGVQR